MNDHTLPLQYVVQSDYANSPEGRAVHLACTLKDLQLHRLTMDRLDELPDRWAEAVPVGSVEFVRAFAAQAGVMMPAPIDYPEALRKWLHRDLWQDTLSNAPPGAFVKPVLTKAFEAIAQFRGLEHYPERSGDELCWISTAVAFEHEWRVYVEGQTIMGVAQYDPGEDADLTGEQLEELSRMIEAWPEAPSAYALDIGAMRQAGEGVALVEVNDAWATGFYGHAMGPSRYAGWLATRWQELQQPK